MYNKVTIAFIFGVTIFCIVHFTKSEENFENEEFIPTHEWQEVKEGQAIPPGLHIKFDMLNGGKWAKINDDETSGTSLVALEEDQTHPNMKFTDREKAALKFWEENLGEYYPDSNDKTYEHKDLEKALKKFKDLEKKEKNSKAADEEVKTNFRPIDEIKTALKDMNIDIKTDYEVVVNLYNIYKNISESDDTKLAALKDIEFYVHQIDTALDFVKMGGMNDVASALNHTSPDFRHEAARIIASAAQSNPKVQIACIETGALNQLTRMLSDEREEFRVRKSSLFAISALIRQFPVAQAFFGKFGGFSAIMQLFRQKDDQSIQLQIKSIRLITDIMEERYQLTADDPQYKEKIKQYNLLPVRSLIEDMHLCSELLSLLHANDHERIQAVLEALHQFKDLCNHGIHFKKTQTRLNELMEKYSLLSMEDKDDEYFPLLKQLSESLLRTSHVKQEL